MSNHIRRVGELIVRHISSDSVTHRTLCTAYECWKPHWQFDGNNNLVCPRCGKSPGLHFGHYYASCGTCQEINFVYRTPAYRNKILLPLRIRSEVIERD